MDAMVIKYLLLTVVAYGLHTFLAITQILLALFLIVSGVIHLRDSRQLGKWSSRIGFVKNEQLVHKPLNCWLMMVTGLLLIVPLLGLSHWFGVFGCAAAIYWIIALVDGPANVEQKETGSFPRKALILSGVLLFGFTIWEGRDLIRAAWDVSYKAAYWRKLEVAGWQKENNPKAPKVGEMAPDFELTDLHGKASVRLSDFKGKRPVVLLFGSFT